VGSQYDFLSIPILMKTQTYAGNAICETSQQGAQQKGEKKGKWINNDFTIVPF